VGEVHRADVRFVEGSVGAALAESEHEVGADDAAGHVPSDHEGEAAEHLPLGEVWRGREQSADSGGKFLVVGHW
jgi:hypothetical protein